MAQTSREVVLRTLDFNGPEHVPMQIWLLPWQERHNPQAVRTLMERFQWDIEHAGARLREPTLGHGDMYAVGEAVDDWGCRFVNYQEGVHGEVKEPLIRNWATDVSRVHFPREWLTVDVDEVNRKCDESDRFMLAGCCPRPFERLQFLRGTENLFIDLVDMPRELQALLRNIHCFYCELLELWATKTNVDALMFMDDWGAQSRLLINPAVWREVFKPLYRDYVDIAHTNGKKIFVHSDGHILEVMPDVVELGIDALNSQIFCMGVENVARFAGQITFWGELDRQYLLPEGTPEQIEEAARSLHRHLWRNGGWIAQLEFGAGAKLENAMRFFEYWEGALAQG